MMRRTMAGVVLATSLAFSAFSNAQASGYPMASIVTRSGSTILMVGRFSNASFSFQEADAYAAKVASLLAGQSATTYTPSQLAAYGDNDATALINQLYPYYQSLGFTEMVYFNIRRIDSLAGSAYGVFDQIDIYVANLSALTGGVAPGDYVASFEFPESYLAVL